MKIHRQQNNPALKEMLKEVLQRKAKIIPEGNLEHRDDGRAKEIVSI